jgi:molybdate transport system substrate-binding protein
MNKSFVLLSVLISITLTGCATSGAGLVSTINSGQANSQNVPAIIPATSPAKHILTVFAAASLTGAFQEIGKNYETSNPGVKVNFNFAGSQILRTQIEQGALADVFASADHMNMDLLVTENLVAGNTYKDFVSNQLVVILPPGNPANVQALGDLARPNLKLVLADSSVPAGNYARQVLSNISKDPMYGVDFISKVLKNVVSNETDVKQVVTKVELGEADAGIAYTSDAIATPSLATISIPDKFNVIASYPIAILTSAPEPNLAAAFVAYVISPAGQTILGKWGFKPGQR